MVYFKKIILIIFFIFATGQIRNLSVHLILNVSGDWFNLDCFRCGGKKARVVSVLHGAGKSLYRGKGMVPHVQLSINCRIGCCFTEKYFS